MRPLAWTAAVLVVLGAAPSVAATRTISFEHTAAGVSAISLDTSVGDVEIVAADTDTISAEVELRPKTGIFGSSRRSEEEMEKVEVDGRLKGDTLELQLSPRSHDDYKANWSVRLPASLAVTLDAGVGDVRIQGVRGALKLDLGVGDIRVSDASTDVEIDNGVGDVSVDGHWAAFGEIDASCGVGDATVRTPDGRLGGKGFIGHEASTKGPGSARLKVDNGVGDVTISLR
jgi:hypothetical protein